MTHLVTTLILTFIVLLAVIAGMSIGVMHGRKAISGSCGGVGGRGCELCTKKCRRGSGKTRTGDTQ